MAKISSKYLNMEGLQALLDASKNKSDFDGALIITSFGMIIGTMAPVYSETDIPHAAELVNDYKQEYVSLFKEQNKEELQIIGDGSLVVLENATVIYSNNNKLELDEISIHCDDVIGFTPINIEKFKKSIN
ncbi:MAG: hypothetical protein E7213_05485 [Clostridium sp.]|nr:hypothetical protein [Clostridium sp.]